MACFKEGGPGRARRRYRDSLHQSSTFGVLCSSVYLEFAALAMGTQEMTALDRAVQRSLRAFLHYIKARGWTGRENEAVSLYALGFLQRECKARTPLRHPTQIGIEVGATDSAKKGPNSQTRKDLVIWREAGANRWFPRGERSEPLAIMEWKVSRTGFRPGRSNSEDRAWLASHCRHHPRTVGYAVLLLLSATPPRLDVHRIDCEGEKALAC